MNIILESLVGSTAYGLNTPTSDKDYLGIYLEPKEYFLGLELITEKKLTKEDPEIDRVWHELSKFCRLALKCNPTVTELLWVPEDLITVNSDAGRILRDYRTSFLSAKLVKSAYLGYATAQLTRLQERGSFGSDLNNRVEKHARHLARLLYQGYTLYSMGELPIKLNNPDWFHYFGKEVANNPYSGIAPDLISYYEKLFNDSIPAIPLESDRNKIEDIVQYIREVY